MKIIPKYLLCMTFLFMTTAIIAQVPVDEPYIIHNLKSGKYGFAMNKHKLIPAIYDSVLSFSEGLAGAKTQAGWGYIDLKGKVAIPFLFSGIRGFSEGYAGAAQAGKWGVVDTTGQWVISPQFTEIAPLVAGAFEARVGDKWGLLLKNGTWACPPQYKQIGWYSEGKWSVRDSSGRWGYLDENYRLTIPCMFSSVGNFKQDLAPARLDDPGYGYIDIQGRWKIQPQFALGLDFHDGFAIVLAGKSGEKYQLIDTLGRFALPSEFDDLYDGGNGYYLAVFQHKYSFWRPPSSLPIIAGFDGAGNFQRGYAFVCMGCAYSNQRWEGGQWGLLDTLGHVYQLPQKFQADFLLNSAENMLANQEMDEQLATWIERSRMISAKAFIFGK